MSSRRPASPRPRVWEATASTALHRPRRRRRSTTVARYPERRAAYRGGARGPDLAIVDKFFLASGGGPPAHTSRSATASPSPTSPAARNDVHGRRDRQNDFANNGLFEPAAAKAAFGDRAVPSRAYVDVREPDAFVATFAGQYLAERRAARRRSAASCTTRSPSRTVLPADPRLSRARADRRRRRDRRDHGAGRARAPPSDRRVARAGVQGRGRPRRVRRRVGVRRGRGHADRHRARAGRTWSITLTDAFGADLAFRVPSSRSRAW